MVGDEQGVEAEILNSSGELLDAPRALQAVSLPDVRGQEDAEASDITHAASSSLLPERPIVDGLTARGSPARAWQRMPWRPRPCPPWRRYVRRHPARPPTQLRGPGRWPRRRAALPRELRVVRGWQSLRRSHWPLGVPDRRLRPC